MLAAARVRRMPFGRTKVCGAPVRPPTYAPRFQPFRKTWTRWAPAPRSGSPSRRSPTEASIPGGTSSRNVVRYQVTPWRRSPPGSAAGDTRSHPPSSYPGRCQPWRSPYSPPLLSGPRTGSGAAAPMIRQRTSGEAPSNAADVSPRASRYASWPCCVRRTRTDRTGPSSPSPPLLPPPALLPAARRSAARRSSGSPNAAVPVHVPFPSPAPSGWWLPSGTPSSQAISRPSAPVLYERDTRSSPVAPVRRARYQTSP